MAGNFKFTYVKTSNPKPDITIIGDKRKDSFRADCQGTALCPFEFDGEGGSLGHAYFPQDDVCREIHLDLDEKWYSGLDGNVPKGATSFYMVLLHEIGHTLGIGPRAGNCTVL